MTEPREDHSVSVSGGVVRSGDASGERVPPVHPDGTVLLPDAIESWLDGHFAGERGDDADELALGRNIVAVALWSLLYRQGDPDDDQAALDVFADAAAIGRTDA